MRTFSELLIFFGLLIVFLAVGEMLVLFTLALWYQVPANTETLTKLFDIQQLLKHPEGVWIIFYKQGLMMILSMWLSGWVFRNFFSVRPLKPLQTQNIRILQIALVILLMFALIPFINALVWWNNQINLAGILGDMAKSIKEKEEGSKLMMKLLTSFPTIWHFWIAALVMAVIPAFCEEYWFRGILQNKLKEAMNPHTAVWVTGFIFSLLHFQLEGFIARWLLGALFGYLYLWSGNLWTTILAHFMNNFITLSAIYLYNHKWLPYNFYEPAPVVWYWVILSVFATVAILYPYKKISSIQESTH